MVGVDLDIHYHMYGGFSPNGDGVNDTYEILVENVDSYEIQIFYLNNPNVGLVYQTGGTYDGSEYLFLWDGSGSVCAYYEEYYTIFLTLKNSYGRKIEVNKSIVMADCQGF